MINYNLDTEKNVFCIITIAVCSLISYFKGQKLFLKLLVNVKVSKINRNIKIVLILLEHTSV